jgi:hypothetical protein
MPDNDTMPFKNLRGKPDVVYKLVKPETFYAHLEDYLNGKLYFADWHKFDDKREGKYLCSASVAIEFREELDKLKTEKGGYTVCSTTLKPDIFELWDRFLNNPPALCLALRINGLDKESLEEKVFNGFTGRKIEYKPRLENYTALSGTPEEKAVQILTTKKIRWAYEQEYRLMKKDAEPGMYKVGEAEGIIIGGRCPMADSAFNKLRNVAAKKKIPIFHAYIDYAHESVEIQESVYASCISNL